MSEEEKIAKLELNRFIYGKQLSKDDIADYLGILFNLIEKQQKEIEEKNVAINKMSKDISRQLEEIEEKSTIIMAGAEKVKQLEKEIEELKNNELDYTTIYIKKEVMDALCMLYDLAKKDTTYTTQDEQFNIVKKYIKKQQKEIEELKKPKYIINCKTNEITKLSNDFISKDKIREKIKKAKEIKWQIPKLVIEYFEELLEENDE